MSGFFRESYVARLQLNNEQVKEINNILFPVQVSGAECRNPDVTSRDGSLAV